MPSEMSSFKGKGLFNAALFRKNLTRFWPIWGVYTAILFFLLPANLLLMAGENWRGDYLEGAVIERVSSAITLSIPLAAFFGLITAMALFSYLMSGRSAQMFHALPIRREGLFLTNYLSGLWFFLAPNLVIFLITLAAEAALGALVPRQMLLWLLFQSGASLFFFCFASCCAMFTGHILALPVFYGVLNILVIGMTQLVEAALTILLVGYSGSLFSSAPLVRWLTPAYHLLYLLETGITYRYSSGNASFYCDPQSAIAFLAYCLLLGGALTLIALAVYRRRHLERAGDLVTVGWVRPVFQYGFGLCLGFVVGSILYGNYFNRFGPWAFIACVALCAALGSFAGRMLLKKTLKVFRDGWKGSAALACCVLLLLGGARADLFGYQRWTPASASVEKVHIRGINTAPYDSGNYIQLTLSDPQLISQVVELHAAITDRLDDLEADRHSRYQDFDEDGYENYSTTSVYLEYTLSSGRMVSRRYNLLPLSAGDLKQPDTPTALLSALLNQPQVTRQAYLSWLDESEEKLDLRATGGWLSGIRTREDWDDSPQFSPEEAQALWEAFQQDLDAGRVKRYLLDDKERNENCFYTDLTLTLSWNTLDEDGERASHSTDLTITPEKSASALMAALEELGYRDLLVSRDNSGQPDVPTTEAVAVDVEAG